jgi:hypothetical protein
LEVPDERRLLDLDRDGLFLGLFGLGQSNLEHAVFEGSFDLILLDLAGQFDGSANEPYDRSRR